MGIHWRVAPNAHEARCIIRQRLIRPLELYLIIKCADYAMFLLTRCVAAARMRPWLPQAAAHCRNTCRKPRVPG